jgi:UDPglucose--hexose-1-phosphate uridylyltransferase
MELRRETVTTEILDPRREFQPTRLTFEQRWDPLTGHTSRILPEVPLLARPEFDLERMAEGTRAGCPFCPERIETATPRLPPAIVPEGRIGRGEALLFPNLAPYSRYSSVSVYSPRRHFLPLAALSPSLVADNLAAQSEYSRCVAREDPDGLWISINANHMLPSGSSVFHPHLQGSAGSVPTTFQRLLAEASPEQFDAYVQEEKRQGRRYLGNTGGVDWLAGFAPLGPAELRAVVFGVPSPDRLDEGLVAELGHGISVALGLYDDLGFDSFNLAIYGGPPQRDDHPLNLRLVGRSNVAPLYRSDATWLERLHWEAAVDLAPEEVAERAAGLFSA